MQCEQCATALASRLTLPAKELRESSEGAADRLSRHRQYSATGGACWKARVLPHHRQPMANQHAVVIAGAGPTGLMLAGELTLAGVDVAIVERRVNQDVPGSRAGGLHPRTIEVLDQRGIAERFISEGTKYPAALHF